MTFHLSRELFAIFAALIEERLGLAYRADDRKLLESKLATRAVDAGFDSLLDYYYYLRYDPGSAAEFQELIDTLVVNESYLFREYRPLRYITDEILLPAVQRGERPRVWSAACAGGEEPLGLAILLAELEILDRVELVASDISGRALARARRGELGRRSIREVPEPGWVERWVERAPGETRVRPPLPQHIAFHRVNLTDAATARGLGTFDVILCRNVLIYFPDDVVHKTLDMLLSHLKPGGTLWVGVSESLMRFAPRVICEERQGVFFYRSSTS